jgi:hypothetical protein
MAIMLLVVYVPQYIVPLWNNVLVPGFQRLLGGA